MFFTFAEGSKPQTLAAVKAGQVPYADFFKFNFGVLFNKNFEDEDDSDEVMLTRLSWNMGMKSFKNFFHRMNKGNPKTLTLTRAVLNERSKLEDALNSIQENVMISVVEFEKLKEEQEVLKHYQDDIDKNKDYTYDVTEQYVELEELDKEYTAINCKTCNVTCNLQLSTHGMMPL